MSPPSFAGAAPPSVEPFSPATLKSVTATSSSESVPFQPLTWMSSPRVPFLIAAVEMSA